jgi:2-octaprenyl-6-methoxyphenol hydroxylase
MGPFCDIVVAGAGPAGAAFALAAKRALGALADVALVDPALASESRRTLRAVAIAPDVKAWLDGLGVWNAVAAHAQPIHRMVITDGRPGALPAPDYLTFDGTARPEGALATMILADDLRTALLDGCRVAGVRLEAARLVGLAPARYGLAVTDAEGRSIRTRLLVAADGSRSRLRHAARIQSVGEAYDQAGIVATLHHPVSHAGQAVQHFLPGGPLALLPLKDDRGEPNRTSIVWTVPSAEAERLTSLPPADFVAALIECVGHAYGPLTLEDRPAALPLALVLARRLVATRVALIGDAARVIHPLAGQGLNLGLRDAAALATRVASVAELGLDPSAAATLDAYQRDRQFDAVAMAATTDVLNRLFSNDRLPVRTLRDIGLSLVDRAPWLKDRLIGGAAGLR